MTDVQRARAGRGRPPSTSREEVARTALELFVRNGFEDTTVSDVADALDVGRRTLFRYFESKNDMVWGHFEWVLDRLRAALTDGDPDEPMMRALSSAVLASNRYDEDALEELRLRMTLITTVPALQAHSLVRYRAWRAVVQEFVARRLDREPDDLVPLMVGHMALGTSMAAFERWVAHPDEDIQDHLRRGYAYLEQAFPDAGLATGEHATLA
jgi:TetR/AcrR family transcriptional regulator, regulator of mycofactocin system